MPVMLQQMMTDLVLLYFLTYPPSTICWYVTLATYVWIYDRKRDGFSSRAHRKVVCQLLGENDKRIPNFEIRVVSEWPMINWRLAIQS